MGIIYTHYSESYPAKTKRSIRKTSRPPDSSDQNGQLALSRRINENNNQKAPSGRASGHSFARRAINSPLAR